jgi:outer membrane lipoprotein SlyB
MFDNFGVVMKSIFLTIGCAVAIGTAPVFAQSSGQSVSVRIGVIDKAEAVTLQNTGTDAGKGALVGGAIGYNLGSGKSSSKKRRHAVIGGALGAAAGRSGTAPGMEYTVKLDDGSTVVVISDQVHLKAGDCVSIEQARTLTNIREQDPAACNPEVREALADLQDELAEDADECAQVKQELLAATTIEAVEIATAKARILCN